MNKAWPFIKNLITYCIDKGVSRHAKALTFSTILALVPMLILFFSSIASSPWIMQAQEQLNSLLVNNLFPTQIRSIFIDYFTVIVSKVGQIKTLGLIFLIFTIILLFIDIEDSFNDLTVGEHSTKHWALRIWSVVSLFIIPICLVSILAILDWLVSMSPNTLQLLWLTLSSHSFIIKAFVVSLIWLWFYFIYKTLPHKKIKTSYIIFGASVATLLFIAAQQLFSLYLTFASYDLIYGAFSVIPVFLIWVNINWQITLYCLSAAFFYDEFISSKEPQPSTTPEIDHPVDPSSPTL